MDKLSYQVFEEDGKFSVKIDATGDEYLLNEVRGMSEAKKLGEELATELARQYKILEVLYELNEDHFYFAYFKDEDSLKEHLRIFQKQEKFDEELINRMYVQDGWQRQLISSSEKRPAYEPAFSYLPTELKKYKNDWYERLRHICVMYESVTDIITSTSLFWLRGLIKDMIDGRKVELSPKIFLEINMVGQLYASEHWEKNTPIIDAEVKVVLKEKSNREQGYKKQSNTRDSKNDPYIFRFIGLCEEHGKNWLKGNGNLVNRVHEEMGGNTRKGVYEAIRKARKEPKKFEKEYMRLLEKSREKHS